MGCGQSKINLYPRRSKNSKASSKKTAAAVDTNESEEEEGCPEATPEDTDIEDHQPDIRQHVLPITEHQPAFEVSISQQNFFKMLDEKVEQGKDYDSNSETELQEEEERRCKLIELWHAHSQSTQSPLPQASSPTPASKQRLTRSVSKASERQCTAGTSRQCYRQESPPTRRSHNSQTHDPSPSTSTGEWDPNKSPMKRTQSAGPSWRNKPKVSPMPKSVKKDEPVAGCSKDSQITYNPTFQNHSPAHSSKSQPYITQIVSCPLSQQIAPSSPAKYIAPPEEYQDPDVPTVERTVTQVNTQSQIYYIHGNNAATGTARDIVQQRQQTAIHLQQYVAMKQAQQQMFSSYLQSPANAPRMYEGEELAAQYGYPGPRAQGAHNRAHVTEVTHMNVPVWSPLPPVMTTQWAGEQVPHEMQYYPQFVPMPYANSAGSAGTLTRYHKKNDEKVQTINVVRGKPVGQIVAVGGQELAVSSTVSDSPSPASVSTDSGVSPGTSAPSSKSSFSSTPPTTTANDTFDPKPKKKSTNKRTLKVSKSLDA